MPKIFALVPAAGQGTRLGEPLPKQYLPLAGRPMLLHALEALASVARIERVLVIVAPQDRHWAEAGRGVPAGRVEAIARGGARRGESVANGLEALAARAAADDWILVHDAARPCVHRALLERFLDAIGDDPVGGLLAMPVADTLKREGDAARVEATVAREGLWRAQTPQMFRFAALRRALAAHPAATDEAQAVEALGMRPRLVRGEEANVKVTFAEDLALAEAILAHRRAAERDGAAPRAWVA